jgi:hypothetical protein
MAVDARSGGIDGSHGPEGAGQPRSITDTLPLVWGTQPDIIDSEYDLVVALDNHKASWKTLPPMGAVQEPRLVTTADVPRLRDRVRIVHSMEGRQHRSGQEFATSVISLIVVCAVNCFISMSASSTASTFAESIGAFAVITLVSTAFLIRIRFKG